MELPNQASLLTLTRIPARGSWQLDPAHMLYASWGKGLETPTLNELSYSGPDNGFGFDLQSATSKQLEIGLKARLGQASDLQLALFQIDTDDELVVESVERSPDVPVSVEKPRKFEISAPQDRPVLLSRLRSVSLLNEARSLISMLTVRISPMLRARASLNRADWLSLHSE